MLVSQTPSTPSTAGVYESFALVSSDESADYVDFTGEVGDSLTPSQWSMEAKRGMTRLRTILSDADANDSTFEVERMHPLSLHEEVEREIQKVIRGEVTKARSIDEIEKDRDEASRRCDYHLKSLELASYYTDEKFDKFFRNLKLHVSVLNGAPLVTSKSDSLVGCITFQFYKTSANREIKLLEFDFPLQFSLLDFFTFVCAQLPNDYMFDGPMYAGSGLIVIDQNMYVTGKEDYSVPICNWLGPNVAYSVHQMSEVVIGEMPNLTSLCSSTDCGFLLFNGDEELRFFVSNIKLSTSVLDTPVMTFKRKLARITRCVLCKTTAADLVVLNDTMLPNNPSHCCTRCYRRFRADRSGNFISPPPDVLVSVYRQI